MPNISASAAVAKALATTSNQPGYCLATVNQYFGTLASIGAHAGEYPDAVDCWTYSTDKHEGDKNPPAGAVVLWGALTHPRWPGDENFGAGDICLSLGGGQVRATDYPTAGRVGTCSIDQRTAQIGRPYLGWCGDFLGYSIALNGTEAMEEDMPTVDEIWQYPMVNPYTGKTDTAGDFLRYAVAELFAKTVWEFPLAHPDDGSTDTAGNFLRFNGRTQELVNKLLTQPSAVVDVNKLATALQAAGVGQVNTAALTKALDASISDQFAAILNAAATAAGSVKPAGQ